MSGGARIAVSPVPLPAGAEFLTLTHRDGRDQRDYKLYIPAARPSSPMPLIVMLHGCTQAPDDFAAGTGMNALAERHGFLVAYPAQPTGANANKCWNWFKPEDQARDRGEPALIAGLTRDILRDHPVDPARVYIAGLSAGGAAAAIVAAAYPDLFSAVGVHSGLPVGAASDVPQAFAAMRSGARGTTLTRAVPTIAIHGMADATVHPSNGKAVIAQTLNAIDGMRASTRNGVSTGGRRFRQTSYGNGDGRSMAEHWEIDGAGHAWAGGQPEGSYTDPTGPAASDEMVRFFLQHAQG
jgi:poly(hydroxyalkanoate) depolymerase family esterase